MIHNCDLCGSSDTVSLPVSAAYTAPEPLPVICASCGFVYVRKRRPVAEIARAWDDIYASGAYNPDWPGVRARLWYVAEFVNRYSKINGRRILDIGAGNGVFLEMMWRRGMLPSAIEPYPKNAELLKSKGVDVFEGAVEDYFCPPDKRFDIVSILWTLENCGDCIAMLRKAAECTRLSGMVVIATGSRILVPYKKPLSRYLSKNPADTHCFRWSRNSLARALKEAGLMAVGWNDYVDRDEMIVLAMRDDNGVVNPDSDDPVEVAEFFAEWERQFP